MRILYFHQHFTTPQGGTGTRSYEMSRRLVARGHSVTVICGSHETARTGLSGPGVNGIRIGVVNGIKVVEILLPQSNHDGFLKRSFTFLRYAWRSTRFAWVEDYDLSFATSTPLTAGIPGILMKLFQKKPFIFEVRDLWPELPREMGVIKNPIILACMSFLEWLSYRKSDGCIGLSPGIVEGIKRRAQPDKAVVMVPNGCDLDLFQPRERTDVNLPGIERNDFVIMFTGAHGIANGLDAVLDAAAVLRKSSHSRVKFVFVGEGKMKPHLIKRAQNERLSNCVFLDLVPKEELSIILGRANMGMMILANCPAFYYGTSPNKFFDYIASGLPVLNNYPGWLAEMIEEHDCGVVIPPADPNAFAAALIALAASPQRVHEMGRNARKLAEKEFGRDILGERFCRFLEEHGTIRPAHSGEAELSN